MQHYTKLFLIPVAIVALGAVIVPVAVRLGGHAGLAALGFPDASGGTVSLGLHRTRIAGIRIGKKGEATITVAYSAANLLRGRADTITVSGTRLRGVVELGGAVKLDGYRPSPGPASSGPISLPADAVVIQDVALELETPVGMTVLSGTGTLAAADGGVHLTGTAYFMRGTITGTAPVDFTLSPTGWAVRLDPIRIDFPGKADGPDTAAGHLALTKAPGMPVAGEAQLDGQDLRLADIPVRTFGATLALAADGLSGTLKLVPADGSAGLDGTVKSGADGVTASVTAAVGDVAPIAKAAGWTSVGGPVKARLSLAVPPATGPQPLSIDLAYEGATPGGAVLKGAKLTANGTYDSAANAVRLTSCGAFSADGIDLPAVTLGKLSGCLGPAADRPFFSQDASGYTTVASAATGLAATLLSGTKSLAEIKIQSATAGVGMAEAGITEFDAALGGASITLPGLGTGLQNLGLKVASAPNGVLSGAITGGVSAIAPNSPTLPVTGTIGGNLANPTASLAVGPLIKAILAGKSARVDMPLTEVGQGGADILRLMPGLATSASKLSGSLAFHAEADWSGAKTTSKGSITAKDIAATTPNFTVDGVNAAISLPSLSPLVIADKQVLTTKTLMVGVPLTDGEVVFGMNKDRILNIVSARWSVAGGTVSTYDQQLDLYGPDQHMGVVIKDIDLAQVLKLVNVNGLTAEGTLVGAIPLRHTKDTILVQHGVLQTRAEGIIRYDPADTPSFLQGQPGEGTAILRDALKDFHYQRLGITIDGVLGGDQQIKMTLTGANPKLYGGLPVSLNVNLTGALDSIARSSVEAYTHPTETVRKTLNKKKGETK